MVTPVTPEQINSLADSVVVDSLWGYAYKVIENKDKSFSSEYAIVKNMPPGYMVIYSISLVEAEVGNGGFNQYFVNSSYRFANDALESYVKIGSKEYSVILKKAIDIYNQDKNKYEKLRNSMDMDEFSKSYDNNPLNDLDDAFYDCPENIDSLKIAYIRNHISDFTAGKK